jgi:hypothetical protein
VVDVDRRRAGHFDVDVVVLALAAMAV